MSIITADESADTLQSAAPGYARAELAVREQNGVEVTLFWIRGTDVLLVAVTDRRNGESLEFALEPGDRPLEVFHHPYAYAAARGIDTGPSAREPVPELDDL
jgi:hypothetical protein